MKHQYLKSSLSISQQIEFLIEQGIKINHVDSAKAALNTVSYYRLSGYFLPFKLPHNSDVRQPRKFKDNVEFESVWQLYQFDQALRGLVFNAAEKIEIALKTVLVNVTSSKWGPFWYTEKHYFKNENIHNAFMKSLSKIVEDKHEIFLRHYYEKYDDPKFPPIWMMVEAISFGTCSKLFSNIKSMEIRNEIAAYFGNHTTVIESWFQTMTYARNLSAHHLRLWNRWLINSPIIPKGEQFRENLVTKNYRFHMIAYVIHRLLEKIELETREFLEKTTLLSV